MISFLKNLSTDADPVDAMRWMVAVEEWQQRHHFIFNATISTWKRKWLQFLFIDSITIGC